MLGDCQSSERLRSGSRSPWGFDCRYQMFPGDAPSPDIREAEQVGQVQGSHGEQNPAFTLLSFTHLQLDQKVTTEHEQEVYSRGIKMANRHWKRFLASLSFAISIKFPLTQQFYI